MTLTLIPPTRTCPAWCTDHDTEAEVCSTGAVRLYFTPDVRGTIDDACVVLAASSDGVSIHVGMDGTGYGMTVNGARDLALAILAKCDAARTGGAS